MIVISCKNAEARMRGVLSRPTNSDQTHRIIVQLCYHITEPCTIAGKRYKRTQETIVIHAMYVEYAIQLREYG